jgi:hypothetical protein
MSSTAFLQIGFRVIEGEFLFGESALEKRDHRPRDADGFIEKYAVEVETYLYRIGPHNSCILSKSAVF